MWRSLVARLLWEQEVGGSNPLTPTILTVPGPRADLDADDANAARGEPVRDLGPRLGLAMLPRIDAALGHDEVRQVLSRRRFDQTRQIGARAAELEHERFGGHGVGGQRQIVGDATAGGCYRAGVSDDRSLSWGRAAVNPHLVLIANERGLADVLDCPAQLRR